MSNSLAIATVTAALQQILQNAIQQAKDLPNAVAVIGHPKAPNKIEDRPEVVITLYEIAPNLAYRNADLPMRNLAGELVTRPSVGADLYYLLTFYGKEEALEPQRLLGIVMAALHAEAVLTKYMIEETINNPIYDYLKTSDLAAHNREQVKFTLHSIVLEDISKLWSAFYQSIPYSLSIAYRASMVLIDVGDEIKPAPEVKTPQVKVNLMESD